MKKRKWFQWILTGLAVLSVLSLLHCRTVVPPKVPDIYLSASEAERKQVYINHHLKKEGSLWWGNYFLQGNNPEHYRPSHVQILFDLSSSEAQAEFHRGSRLNTLANYASGLGGVLISYPLGTYIGDNSYETFDLIYYGTGLGLIIASYILALNSDIAYEDAVKAYNTDLKTQLDL